MSQGQLGAKIGAHVTSISDWERGANDPSGRHVAGLTRELGVEAEHFYDEDETADDSEADLATQLISLLRRFVQEERGHLHLGARYRGLRGMLEGAGHDAITGSFEHGPFPDRGRISGSCSLTEAVAR